LQNKTERKEGRSYITHTRDGYHLVFVEDCSFFFRIALFFFFFRCSFFSSHVWPLI